MGQNKSKPETGDLIEIDQPFHQHWALCIEDGYVIHLTPVGKDKVKLGAHKVPVFTRMVKKERLEQVVQRNKWRVNNKSDVSQKPLPVKEIISRAATCVGKEVICCSFGRNCEHFVTNLRYGEAVSEQLKAFVGGELHILDMRDDKGDPKPGDLIEINRGQYAHWALYVGDGYVIHVTTVGKNSSSVSTGSVSLPSGKGKVKVMKELLKEVAGNDNWHVNNKYDHCRTPFPVEEIIRRAESEIGKLVPYRLLHKNCEHFVTKLRYGEGVSEQAMTALLKIRNISSALISGVGTATLGVLARLHLLPGFALPLGYLRNGVLVIRTLPLLASIIPPTLPFELGLCVGMLTSIAVSCLNTDDHFTHAKFLKANKDILEERCC